MSAPKLDGLPSPALKKMKKMSAEELRAYVNRLRAERQLISDSGTNKPAAMMNARRLDRLIQVAEQILATPWRFPSP